MIFKIVLLEEPLPYNSLILAAIASRKPGIYSLSLENSILYRFS